MVEFSKKGECAVLRTTGRAGAAPRRRVTLASLVVAAFIVPVAIAYACNPQAHVSLDKTSYQPGSAITVYGSYFPGNVSITVNGPGGSTSVTTSPGGGFSTQLTAPTSPGTYTITASRPTGGFAPASFSVVAPPAAASTPAEESAPATAAPPQQQAAGSEPAFRTPSVARSQAPASAERTTRPTRSGSTATRGEARGQGSGARTTVTSSTGQRVFAGSTAQAAPAAAPRTSATAPAPAEQAALSDLFSDYQPGRTPSLAGTAAGAPAGGAGSGAGLGIGLMAFGLLALVAGLTAAEVRRRRPA